MTFILSLGFQPLLHPLPPPNSISAKVVSTNAPTLGKGKTKGENILVKYLPSQASTLLSLPAYLMPCLPSLPLALPLFSYHILCEKFILTLYNSLFPPF